MTHPFKVGAGTSLTTMNIAKYFERRGFHVDVMAIYSKKKNVLKDGVNVLCFKYTLLKDFSMSFLKYILKYRYDYFIFVGSNHIAFSIAAIFLKMKSQKVLFIPQWHSSMIFRDRIAKVLFCIKRLFCDYFVWALTQPILICYTSEETRHLKNLSKAKTIFTIPLGITLNRALWQTYNIIQSSRTRDYVTLLFVGRVDQNKFPPYVIDVVKACRRRVSKKLIFYVVGPIDNRYFNKLKSMIKKASLEDFFIFKGPVEEHILARYFKRADVFVFPSFSESFGLSVIEALYAGLPVVSTRTGIVPYLERLGCVEGVNFENAEDMAKKIYIVCSDQIARKEMLSKAKHIVLSELNMENFLGRLYEIILNKAL